MIRRKALIDYRRQKWRLIYRHIVLLWTPILFNDIVMKETNSKQGLSTKTAATLLQFHGKSENYKGRR